MQKTKLVFWLFIPLILLLNYCYKRPFTLMGVHGQILIAKTNKPPLQAELSLWAGCDPDVACQEANNFGKTQTNEDGTFEIKSKAQTTGNKYYLKIIIMDSAANSSGETMVVSISKNQNLDLGLIKF